MKRIVYAVLIMVLFISVVVFFYYMSAIYYHLSKSEAISILKTNYPEFKDYPNNNLPPQSIRTESSAEGWYVAFVQEGSGVPIIGAKCFLVKDDRSIQHVGDFRPPSVEDVSFSIKTCKGVGR